MIWLASASWNNTNDNVCRLTHTTPTTNEFCSIITQVSVLIICFDWLIQSHIASCFYIMTVFCISQKQEHSRECFSGLLGYCMCVGIAVSIQMHKCLTRALRVFELESPTYIIQKGGWRAGGYQSLRVRTGGLCVCTCWVGRWLPGYRTWLWWYMCVEEHWVFLSMRKQSA